VYEFQNCGSALEIDSLDGFSCCSELRYRYSVMTFFYQLCSLTLITGNVFSLLFVFPAMTLNVMSDIMPALKHRNPNKPISSIPLHTFFR
jgi:hypothetical protein